MEEKEYTITVKLEWTICLTAESKEKAKQQVIDTFAQDHNIDLDKDEIKFEEE